MLEIVAVLFVFGVVGLACEYVPRAMYFLFSLPELARRIATNHER